MKIRFFVATLIVTLTSFIPFNARAEWNGFSMLRDCKNTPNQPCIVGISAITGDGKVIQASLTGRVAVGDGTAPANIDDEYELPGLNFEYPAGNKMIARVFYDGTMFQTVFEAGWLDQTSETRKTFAIISPHRVSSLNCGTPQVREICYRNINFNQDLSFNEVIRVPKTFVTAYVNARTDLISYKTGINPVLIDGVEYTNIDLTIHVTKKAQVVFSDLQPDPLATSDWADSEIDQTIANFYTPKNVNAQRLGSCSGIPAISVISNGLNPDVPVWDASTQTMSVQVSGPHYKINGELNAGFFQARISKEIAKCLWNLDVSSATKAQITLTDQGTGGTQVIETVSGSYDGSSYFLTDSNFHYSSPRFSIRLVNEPAVAQSSAATTAQLAPSHMASTQSKSTSNLPIKQVIVCSKGMKRLKLSGIKPVCPKGFVLTK